MEPIRITDTGEREVSRTPQRGGGELVITERVGVDQYGHEWRSFHSSIEFDEETSAGDQPASEGEAASS